MKNTLSGIVLCLFEILVGVLLLVNPVGFTSGIIIAAGVVLMISGLVSVIKYFRTPAWEACAGQSLTKGLIGLLLGAFCAFRSGWFVATFPVLTLLYGVVILITGLAKLQWMADTIRMKKQRWFLAGISALLSIVCGAIIISSPFGTMAVLWAFTGIALIAEAVFDIIVLIFGRKDKNAEEAAEAEAVEE